MKILLADDNYNFSYVLKKELEEHLIKVDMVNNGVDAILNLLENGFDFILLNIKIPRLNGIDTMKIINRLKVSSLIEPHMLVITFSDEENEEYHNESMKSGAVKYLRKPFNIEALIQFMNSLSELQNN